MSDGKPEADASKGAENEAPSEEDAEDLAMNAMLAETRIEMDNEASRIQREQISMSRRDWNRPMAMHQQWQQQQKEQKATYKDAQSVKPAPFIPKGIPTSMILAQPEEGIPTKYTPGEIQQEIAAEEAAKQRLLEHEARLPELPRLPTNSDFDSVTGDFRGSDAVARLGHGFDARKGAIVLAGPTVAGGLPGLSFNALGDPVGLERGPRGAGEDEEEEESRLETNIAFYIRCKAFLPRATPEQHWATFGLSRQLSRAEWEEFLLRERKIEEVAAERRAERRRVRKATKEASKRRALEDKMGVAAAAAVKEDVAPNGRTSADAVGLVEKGGADMQNVVVKKDVEVVVKQEEVVSRQGGRAQGGPCGSEELRAASKGEKRGHKRKHKRAEKNARREFRSEINDKNTRKMHRSVSKEVHAS